jgi:hypothetical protein
MKQEQVLDHVIGLVDHFKQRKDLGELTASEAGIYLKCLSVLGARDAVMSLNQMDTLSDKMEVLELPFEVRA